MTYDVAIPAGGEVRPDRVAGMGTRYKALADVNGKPLLTRVVERLRSCSSVGRIALVGSPPVLTQLGGLADLTAEDTGSGPGNLLRAFELLGSSGRVLFTGCDCPLLSPEMIEDFLAKCPPEAAICYSYVRSNWFAAAFPDCPFLNIRLRGGSVVGGSLHLADAGAVLGKRELLEEVFEARKKPLKMLRLLGPTPVPLYALGLLTLRAVEQRASQVLGVPCVGVESPYAEMAFDIDKPEHLEIARRIIATPPEPHCPA